MNSSCVTGAIVGAWSCYSSTSVETHDDVCVLICAVTGVCVFTCMGKFHWNVADDSEEGLLGNLTSPDCTGVCGGKARGRLIGHIEWRLCAVLVKTSRNTEFRQLMGAQQLICEVFISVLSNVHADLLFYYAFSAFAEQNSSCQSRYRAFISSLPLSLSSFMALACSQDGFVSCHAAFFTLQGHTYWG